MKDAKKRDYRKIMGWILFVSLVLSALLTLVRLIFAPGTTNPDGASMRRADHTLMLVQCVLAICVMTLPSIVAKKWSIPIPNSIYVLYYVFLYCAVFLGEVLSFYYRVPHWDTLLHTFSGGALASLGLILVMNLNDMAHSHVRLSPFFIALFAFCFALALGAIWEIYEFTIDSVMGLNMQKYLTDEGVPLVGREALLDTMKDIVSDAGAALVVVVAGYVSLKRKSLKKE